MPSGNTAQMSMSFLSAGVDVKFGKSREKIMIEIREVDKTFFLSLFGIWICR